MSNQAAVAGILNYLVKDAMIESLEHAGSQEVVYTKMAKRMALFGLVLMSAIMAAILLFIAKPEERIIVAWVFGFFVLLTLILVAEFYGARITYDAENIHTRSAWRGRRKIPLAAISACDYSATNNWYRVKTSGHGIIRAHVMMRGIAEFLNHLPCSHAVYPPMDASGRILAGVNLHVADVAGLPGMPSLGSVEFVRPKLTGLKVVALLFLLAGVGMMVMHVRYVPPHEGDYTEVNGKMVQAKLENTGKNGKDKLLSLHLDSVPTVLKLSTSNAPRFAWQAFTSDVHLGDRLTVGVAKADLQHPRQPLAGSEPQIWMVSIKTAERTYVTFADYLAWSESNHKWTLAGAALFFLLGAYTCFDVLRKMRVPQITPARP